MLAFVEGSMERQFINRNFKYLRVVPVSNGISWSVDQLCNQVVTGYRVYDCPSEVFVWLDREKRVETAEEIRLALIDALAVAGVPQGQSFVMVNDRMSENVILADEEVIRGTFGDVAYSYAFEGVNGKHVLKEKFKSIGKPYNEIRDGVPLLKQVRLSRSAATSAAVKSFVDTFEKECWWVS